MVQQTAVEYFDEQIQERVIAQDVVARKMIIEISMEDYINIKKQAKQMEKQQIIEAAKWLPKPFDRMEFLPELAEQYYKETYE